MSLKQAVSGQYLFFGLVSALSGNPVAGSSGSISGRKASDAISGMILLSGNIIELGGGMYRANLFDFDCSGGYMGYTFTASGCVPVNFSMVTMGGMSGAVYPNSGLATGVLSGATVGLFSGQNVNVFSGQLSGQLVTAASGVFGTANINSGQLVNVFSGQLSGFQVNLLSGNQTQVWSGTQVNVFSGQLSGQPVTLTSGLSYTASGIFGVVSLASGTTFLASGQAVSLNSGQSVNVFSGQLSGQQVNLTSGQSYTASGIFAVATATVASGQVYLASGTPLFFSGLYNLASGQNVGLQSGQTVNVFSGQLSGQQVTPTSGQTYFASGQVTIPASGSLYLASGVIFPHTFSSGTATQFIPESIFKANFSGITGEAERSLLNANRKLINKWDAGVTLSGFLTVFKENDSTAAYTQAIGSTSGAAPITSLDT